MTRIITAVVTLGALGTVAVGGQAPQWAEYEIGGGAIEFRLTNDEGAALILACYPRGVLAGFEYPALLKDAEQATVRGIPGEQLKVAVTHVNDGVVRVGGRGVEIMLGLVRSAARLHVRVAAESAFFDIAGSGHVVGRCLERQDEAIRTAGPDWRVPSPNTSPDPRMERRARRNREANTRD